jgi:DNA-binding transcriptional LysR family regulator
MYVIIMINIRKLDLNLLRVFETLMRERNVTRAASRLGLTQPAVSSALKRLRKEIGDELLVRTGRGMAPTRRAEQLFRSVSQSLDSIQNTLLSEASFVPQRSERTFTVMLSDVGEIIYLPRLIRQLQESAPGVRLVVRRLSRSRVHDELASGIVDLAIGWIEHAPHLQRRELFDEDSVCIVRPDHPRVGRKLTIGQLVSEQHLVVGRSDTASIFPGSGKQQVRSAAAVAMRRRKIAMLVPHFLAVPGIISNSDLLCVVPRQLAEVYVAAGMVRAVALPSPSTSFTVSQFWHRRVDTDPGNQWLRDTTRDLFARRGR